MERRTFIQTTGLATAAVGLGAVSPLWAAPKNDDPLHAFFERQLDTVLNSPAGSLKHPYIDPGAAYAGLCWDWDAYFSLRGLATFRERVAPYAVGCVRNFLSFQAPDGSIPYAIQPKTPKQPQNRAVDSEKNSCKPLLAQFAVMANDYAGPSAAFGAEVYPGIARHMAHWEATQQTDRGLFTFRSHRGSGVDDHPAVYCRPFNSSADVYLNCLIVREYEALEALAQEAAPQQANAWRQKRDLLAAAINEWMWDPIDEMYYNQDVGYASPGKVNQPVTWSVPLKVKSWTSFMPLWAGVATTERAQATVARHLLDRETFWTDHGVRSLAKTEPAYEIATGYNPSCWRGPVWVVNNFMMWEGLRAYGYHEQAGLLATNMRRLLQADLATTGALHEYYHPDTGQGLTHPGFVNWNTLVLQMD